jgi:hypothetical protein
MISNDTWTPEAIRALGPTTDVPTLGTIFECSRWKSYQMARHGEWERVGIKVIPIGSKYRVIVQSILDVLGYGSGDAGASWAADAFADHPGAGRSAPDQAHVPIRLLPLCGPEKHGAMLDRALPPEAGILHSPRRKTQRMIGAFPYIAHNGPPVVRVPNWFASLVQGGPGRESRSAPIRTSRRRGTTGYRRHEFILGSLLDRDVSFIMVRQQENGSALHAG